MIKEASGQHQLSHTLLDDRELLSAIITTQNEVATAALDLPAVLKIITERVRELTNASGSAIEFAEGDEMVYYAASGMSASHVGLRLKSDASLSGLCVKTGKTLICTDSEADTRVDREACRRVGARSLVVVPLRHEQRIVGVLKVLSEECNAFSAIDIQVLQLMVGLVATSINHALEFDAKQKQLAERIEELHQANALLDTLFEQAPIGIGLWDRDLRFVRLNKVLAEINGLPIEAHIGKTVKELLPDIDDDVMRAFRQVVETGEAIYDREASGMTPAAPGRKRYWSVSYYPVRIANEISGVGAICEEITAKKLAEAEREELLARERQARHDAELRWKESMRLAAVNRDIAVAFKLKDVFAVICRTARELTGADGAAFILSEGEQVYYADENAIAPLWKGQRILAANCISSWVIREGQSIAIEDIYSDERVHLASYRPTFVKSLMLAPVRSGDPLGAIGVYWATSHRADERETALLEALADAASIAIVNARLYDKMKSARQAAEDANRLKDEFLATVSHELRTPLTSILGWADLLRTGKLDERGMAHAIEIIERNGQSQKQLVEDLLDISRIITGKLRLNRQMVDLSTIIGAAIEAVRPAAEAKGIDLQTNDERQAISISGDPDRLQQVMWNLLSNAIKFTPRGGRVNVNLEQVDSHVEINVHDTGKGIELDFLPFVFDRFRQADQKTTRNYGGLGIGLAIVKQLVELHGGSINVKSEGIGRGTVFNVQLPLTPIQIVEENPAPQMQATGAQNVSSAESPSELDGVQILVVDDEADARDLIAAILEEHGASVITAASATEALEQLANEKPDLLISDIGIPEEDGYTLISKVRGLPAERGGHIPAIALTAYARVEDRVRVLRSGFQLHAAKPIEASELVAAVTNLVARSNVN